MKLTSTPIKPRYRQTERARSTEQTHTYIVKAALKLIKDSRRVNDVTLNAIAEEADVALRTVLRHFRSRDGVFEAAFEQIQETIAGHRPAPVPGDIAGAITSLIDHYEKDGQLNLKALEEESDLPLLHKMLEIGREFHRAWIDEAFGASLTDLPKPTRDGLKLQLYAATDVYLWKLLRLDLKHSKARTKETILELVTACLDRAKKKAIR